MFLHNLTKPQKSIWNMEQYFGGSVANITGSIIFKDGVSVQELQIALNKTVEQCDSLRIRIKLHDGAPMQYIAAFEKTEFATFCFASKNEYDLWVQNLAKVPFDLAGKLYQIFIVEIEGQIGIVFHLHHLTADAWTLNLLGNTVMRNLANEPVRTSGYLEYLIAEQEYLVSGRYARDKDYFLSCFEQCDAPVYLSDRQIQNPAAKRRSFIINTDDAAKIHAFCAGHDQSAYALFLNVLAIYLYRVKGAQDLYIGTTVLNRAGKKDRETAGVFINSVPILFHMEENKTVLENLRINSETIFQVFRHQRYQYIDFLKDIREKYNFLDRLYDVTLNYQNGALVGNGMTAAWYFCGCQGESLNIHINDRQRDGAFHMDYDYLTELFGGYDVK